MDPAILAALAESAPRTILTVQVEAGALYRAMQQLGGGPEWLSTADAHRIHGRSVPYWTAKAREWVAEDAGTAGRRAYQEGSGRWFLRNSACREHLAEKAAPLGNLSRRVPRGPRKR